jgi:hypothetical protein
MVLAPVRRLMTAAALMFLIRGIKTANSDRGDFCV